MVARRIPTNLPTRISRTPLFDPFAPLLSPLLDPFTALADFPVAGAPRAFPPVNAWEDDEGFHIESEIPGFTMDDLTLTLAGDQLTISGGVEPRPRGDGVAYHRRERPASIGGRFTRTIRFMTPIDPEQVSATLEQGVLRIDLPKAAEAKPRQITVQSR